MNKILRSKNPIILLLVILLSGVSLSNTAYAGPAADAVIADITAEDWATARTGYNALTTAEQALVTNYSDLTDAEAAAPTVIALAAGSETPATVGTNVAIPAPGATNTTGAITGWIASTSNKIKFTVTDAAPATSVITINGDAYTSGDDYAISAAASLTIVVTTIETGKTDSVRTFTVAVTAAAPAPAPAPAPAAASFTPSTPQTPLVLTTSATTVGWGSQVKLTLTGGSGTGAVTYSSTGTTFCAVDQNGIKTPVSVGTCTVTANKAGDGTYGSAQSNSITITVTEAAATATTTSVATSPTVVVGNAVAGVTTIRFAIADSFAGSSTRVVLVTKNSAGKSIYRILGNATVSATGAVTFRSKVRIPAKAILQLRSAGSVIFSKMVN